MSSSRRPTTPRRSSAGTRTRPASPVAPPAVVKQRGRLSRLTGRAVVLLLVLAALVMSLAFPLREYVQQRSQIAALEAEAAHRQSRVESLQQQAQRWNDPDFVELQARDRLHYVFPGETGFVVLSPKDVQEARQPEIRVAPKVSDPWYETLWSSLQAADSADTVD